MNTKAEKLHANHGKTVTNGKERVQKHNMYAEFYKYLLIVKETDPSLMTF